MAATLADHVSPLLLLLAPLFWISPTSYPLQLAKIVALGAPILTLYWLLRRNQPTLARLLVLAYVFNPLLHQTALEEFHELMLAAPLLGLAGYAARPENTRLLVREDMGVYVALFGLYWLTIHLKMDLIGCPKVWMAQQRTDWLVGQPRVGEKIRFEPADLL